MEASGRQQRSLEATKLSITSTGNYCQTDVRGFETCTHNPTPPLCGSRTTTYLDLANPTRHEDVVLAQGYSEILGGGDSLLSKILDKNRISVFVTGKSYIVTGLEKHDPEHVRFV